MKKLTVLGFVIFVGLLFAPAASIGAPNVTVTNPASQPVPVKNVENPDKQEIYAEQIVIFIEGPDSGAGGSVAGMTVPSGKRLIIEHASVLAGMPTGQVPTTLKISTSAAKTVYLSAIFQGGEGGADHFIASQPIKMRVEAGETVRCEAIRTLGGISDKNATILFQLSGYLIDTPYWISSELRCTPDIGGCLLCCP